MTRFFPFPREPGVGEGLAARVHDPLWMLARQWQMGEFRGDDAGSPMSVDVVADSHRIDNWRAGPSAGWQPYDAASAPLERLVEQEPANPGDDPRLRAQGGARFVRALGEAGLGEQVAPFVARYGFAVGDGIAPRGLQAALRARLPDGATLAAGLIRLLGDDGAAEASAIGLDMAARAAIEPLARAWLEWWLARAPEAAEPAVAARPEAWDESRMEYAFSVRASTLPNVELRATEYHGGSLDWWSIDVTGPDEPSRADPTPSVLKLTGVPGPARYGGMPTARFWEMEDARIDLGSLDAAPNDLGRLLLVSFATVYGNDWMVVPLRLPVGTLVQVTSFVVTDVFGAPRRLEPLGTADHGWHPNSGNVVGSGWA